ncbi:Protein phosphatase [Phytophthora cinnamomi]|uniref:Protein phosphatase n=1 Tax=Phytophthora cinnamomi TaxID=4785 RepID=UPI003559F9EC|nr:Protein phosphatase [Phytophthora cinnamomi]
MGLALAAAAELTEDPKVIAKHIQEHKEMKAATKKNASKTCTLRRRKTSVRDGKMVASTAAVRGDCAYGHLRNQLFFMIAPESAQLDQEVLAENKARTVATMLQQAVHKVTRSRAVLCRSGDAVELTRDHKPNDPQERARIESLGGRVQSYGCVDAQGEPIEPYGAYRVNDNLVVARAIGDRDSRPFVISYAEIRQYDLEYDKDEFIVIASDGLWDVFTSSEVVEFVQDVMSGELGGREAWSSGGHSNTRVPIFEWSQPYTSDRSIIKAAQRRREVQLTNYLVQEALFRGTSTTCPLWWSGCSTTPSFSD